MTYLTKIKFADGSYGYQETPTAGSSTLLHLYDENGDQLDGGNGHFPNVKWETIGHPPAAMVDSDDFWNTIESMRFATEK